MFQQSLKNQENRLDTLNNEDIRKEFNKTEAETEDITSDNQDYLDNMPQEIDQAIVEQVYSSDWNERNSAMEKLKKQLTEKSSVSEEYAIELFSVLYPNLEDETTPVVKTCVECQMILLEKCQGVLSFIS